MTGGHGPYPNLHTDAYSSLLVVILFLKNIESCLFLYILFVLQNECDCASECSCTCSTCTRYKEESQTQHMDRSLDGSHANDLFTLFYSSFIFIPNVFASC